MTATAHAEVKTCGQHKGGCRPFDRHTQSLRASDEHMAALRAKAESMGMTGNDVIEMLIEEFVGWRKRGEKWKGPRRRWPGERNRRPGARGQAVRPEFVREDAVCAQCDAPWSEGHVCEVQSAGALKIPFRSPAE